MSKQLCARHLCFIGDRNAETQWSTPFEVIWFVHALDREEGAADHILIGDVPHPLDMLLCFYFCDCVGFGGWEVVGLRAKKRRKLIHISLKHDTQTC